MTCPKCGAGIANNVAFCLYCGKQVRAMPKQAPKDVPKAVSKGVPPTGAADPLAHEKSGGIWVPVTLVAVVVAFAVLAVAVLSSARRRPALATRAGATSGIAERMERRVDALHAQIARYRAENNATFDELDQAERQVLKTRALLNELRGLNDVFRAKTKEDSMMNSYRLAKSMVRDALGTADEE